MNLEQLRSFMAVVDTGTFTRASEALHLAQPSLSRQIATLERDLGTQLFRRDRSGSVLTQAGETVLPLARRMLADADSVRRELNELAGLQRGRVRLGATPTLCISLVAEALIDFHQQYPGIELHLAEHGSRQLLDKLGAGELDLALVTTSDPASTGRFSITPLLSEELVVISSVESTELAADAVLSLTEVSALPQIVFSSTYDLRRTTDDAFGAAGLVPNVVLEGAEMDAVLRFVERGLGVAIAPAMVLVNRPELRAHRLRDPRLTRTISEVRPIDVSPTAAVIALHQTIARTAGSLADRFPSVRSSR